MLTLRGTAPLPHGRPCPAQTFQKPRRARVGQTPPTQCKQRPSIMLTDGPSCCRCAGTLCRKRSTCCPGARAPLQLQRPPCLLSLTHHCTEPLHSSLSEGEAPRYFSSLTQPRRSLSLQKGCFPLAPRGTWAGGLSPCSRPAARRGYACAHPAS